MDENKSFQTVKGFPQREGNLTDGSPEEKVKNVITERSLWLECRSQEGVLGVTEQLGGELTLGSALRDCCCCRDRGGSGLHTGVCPYTGVGSSALLHTRPGRTVATLPRSSWRAAPSLLLLQPVRSRLLSLKQAALTTAAHNCHSPFCTSHQLDKKSA